MQFADHYLGTYWIARLCGLQPVLAAEIAWASQAVDDYSRKLVPPRVKILYLDPETAVLRPWFVALTPTQDYAYYEAEEHKCRHVWMPFHFPPNDAGDLLVQELPRWALEMLRINLLGLKAVCEQRGVEGPLHPEVRYACHAVGIADHLVKDSVSHQGFLPCRDDSNATGRAWYDLRAIVPNVGHADAGNDPDEAGAIWWRRRKTVRVENWRRWMRGYAALHGVYAGAGFGKVQELPDLTAADWENWRDWLARQLGGCPEYENPLPVELSWAVQEWRQSRERAFFRAAVAQQINVYNVTR